MRIPNPEQTCLVCGVSVAHKKAGALFCSKSCNMLYYYYRDRVSHYGRLCSCGKIIPENKRPDAKSCSVRCYQRNYKREMRSRQRKPR